MIKFWADRVHLHTVVAVGWDSCNVFTQYDSDASGRSFPDIRRSLSLSSDFYYIRFNDIRINIKILDAGHKI